MVYDVVKMQASLDAAKKKQELSLQAQFKGAFRKIYAKNKVPKDLSSFDVKIVRKQIKKPEDLKGIPSRAGFYIILTDYPMPENPCELRDGELAAVYRGQASAVKKRVSSHLTNDEYNKAYKEREEKYLAKKGNEKRSFQEKYFGACMKIEPKESGINITAEEYNKYNWIVIAHEMVGTLEPVRELAELAFDELFGKPAASRE